MVSKIFFFVGILFQFSLYASSAEIVDRVEAIVNKKAIFKSDITRFKELLPLRAKIDPIFSNDPLSKKQNPSDEDIVSFLVDEMITSDKFPVADSEVEQEINAIQGNLKIDRETLRAAIRREGFKFDDYFKLMKASLAKRQLIEREIRSKAAVSDDDIRAEYNRRKSGSQSFSGSFQIHMIKVSKKNYKSAALAKEEAERALLEIKKGASFEEAAKSHSDDSSQTSGGDLGFLSYSEMSPVLKKEVQKLGPERMSGVIDSPDSYMIVKVGEIKSETDSLFEKEKDVIRARLMENEFQHQIHLWLNRERSQNFVQINGKKQG